MTTVTLHKSIPIADNHSMLKYSFASASARRALSGLTNANRGEVAEQTDTVPATLWAIVAVSGGTATWSRIDTGAEVIGFGGNFGALFTSYSGLTVRGYYRSDLGVSGTTGTGKTALANQLGDYGAWSPATGATNGIGTPGTAVNGKATLVTDASTQGAVYTSPSEVAPATTSAHIWEICRYLGTFSGGPFASYSNNQGDFSSQRVIADLVSRIVGVSLIVSGKVANQWYRVRQSFCGGLGGGASTDRFRVGSTDATAANRANVAMGTTHSFACLYDGSQKMAYEVLCRVHVVGPLATFLTASTAADTEAQSLYPAASIEI